MKKRTIYFCSLVACLLMLLPVLGSCKKDSKPFKVSVELNGLGAQNVRIVYTGADGGIVDSWVKCENNAFSIEGKCQSPSLLMVYNSMNVSIMRLIVNGGDEIEVKGKILEPYNMTIKGTELMEEFNAFVVKHKTEYQSLGSQQLNTAIENYVKDNPKSLVSTVLVILDYSPTNDAQVDKLLEGIDESAKPATLLESYNLMKMRIRKATTNIRSLNMIDMESGDFTSVRMVGNRPSAIFFWNKDLGSDERHKIIEDLKTLDTAQVQILDVNIDGDSVGWYNTIKKDGTSWKHYWVPGSMMNSSLKELRLTDSATIIVTDSLGHQQYRGNDVMMARQPIEDMVGAQ